MPIDSGIIALLLFATIGQIASAIFVPSLPLMVEQLNALPASIQRLASIYLIIYASAHLVGGFFCDRFGRRPIILCGILSSIIGGFITTGGTLSYLYAGRIFQALGFGLSAIATKAIMRDRYNGREYAVVISYFLNVALIAPAIAPLIGAWLTLNFGWVYQFFAVAITTFFTAIAVLFFYGKPISESPLPSQGILYLVMPVIRDTRCMLLSFLSGIIYGSDIAIEIIAPFLLKEEYGADTKLCAYFFAVSLLFIIVGSGLIRFLKSDIEKIVQYGATLMIISVFMLLISHKAILVVSALCLYLLACGMLYSTISAIALLPHVSTAGMAASISGAMHIGIAGIGSALATSIAPSLSNLTLMLFAVSAIVFLFTATILKTNRNKITQLKEG
jgi:DHA1 family bicyclomycin/chloramphenicol resistance-like MFS transporter